MQKKPIKKPVKKNPATLEELKQSYISTTSHSGKKILLGLIKLKDPNFKG